MSINTLKKRKKKSNIAKCFLYCIILISPFLLFARKPNPAVRIMFYNVENLFDTIDDPSKNDNEFLPNGARHWNGYRYFQKLKRISQVIIAAGEGNNPAVIGLCEVENRKVLESLLYFTPLKVADYQIIHQESPDNRGIDVALLYRKGLFTPLKYQSIQVVKPDGQPFITRDILYVKGLLANDTVHFFVNHWPSKYGGVSATKPQRALAASALRAKTDSILKGNPQCNIVIMGDFNDSPFDKSVAEVLGAKPVGTASPASLYSLAYPLAKQGRGSNKYRAKWEMIDQFMVSGGLVDGKGLHTEPGLFRLFSPPFLLEKDQNYLGEKLNRTYIGFKYHGGFSDHLPILLDLRF
jgi:endonuclease/exonuclease/phosphatase family metal-dependent hydrolase